MNPLVSVVMPVYNGEKFINNSIRSYIEQTLKETELIVVNDGSTDNTKIIVEQYVAKDSRIHLINFEDNHGNNIARKTGAMAAKGDYIMFLDVDDALFLNACKQAWMHITETEADIFQFNTKVVFPQDNFGVREKKDLLTVEKSPQIEHLYRLLEPFDGVLTCERILRGCFEQKLFSFTIWNKIYRRETCQKGFSFIPEIYLNLGEDELAFFFISYYSKKYVGDSHLTLYYYTFGSGISTQQSVTLSQIQNLSRCMIISDITKKFLANEGKLDYFKSAVDITFNKYQAATLEKLYLYLINEDNSNKREAVASVLQYCNPITLIKYLAPRFSSRPSVVAEGLLDSDLAKPINKPIKTIGTYYSKLRNGGAEKVVAQLIQIWVEMGYRVILFTDEPAHDTDYIVDASYTRVVLPTSATLDEYEVKATALDSALRELKVDLMIYHKWVDPHLLWDLLVCKQADCAFYIYAHSTIDFFRFADPVSQSYYTQLPSIYKLADCVISLTEMDTAFWGQFSNRAYQVINPCLLPKNKSMERTTHNHRLLWVGRISQEKRPLELIQILEVVLKRIDDAELYIVGTGEPDSIKQLLDYAKNKRILDRVTFTGYQLEVDQFYEQSDIFLLTSSYEGFPLSLFEAQSHGLPTVMYKLPYLTLVKEGKGIIAVDQHAIEEAGNAIVDILMDQEKYECLSKEAYDNAKYFSHIDIKEQWHKILVSEEDEKEVSGKKTTSPSALQLALSCWTRFNMESLHKARMQTQINTPSNTDISEAVNQAIQVKMVNMSILEASVHLVKTVARRVLGKNLSDRIHLFRVRIRGKLA